MSLFHDWRDWLGGYPFEVAKPEDVERRLGANGFMLQRETLTAGLGCNEFVFTLEPR
jgi:2-polyprenyl-6-hydroxyphenyl methylase/3-demethylubiquinone-9 3-methyltransferase